MLSRRGNEVVPKRNRDGIENRKSYYPYLVVDHGLHPIHDQLTLGEHLGVLAREALDAGGERRVRWSWYSSEKHAR
jgi:hypothetical protein